MNMDDIKFKAKHLYVRGKEPLQVLLVYTLKVCYTVGIGTMAYKISEEILINANLFI